jgi:chlorophyllide a reductase subunit Z
MWDLWRSVTQDFFATASFAVVAQETYERGIRNFLAEEMGLPCTFSYQRRAGVKPDNQAIRESIRTKAPLIMFGSYNERMYLAEAGSKAVYIPVSFPGAIIRRHTGTPVMGYSGASWLIQEVCNALFDALFNIIPLSTEMDAVEATPARGFGQLTWTSEANAELEAQIAGEPVLVRISAAKRLREAAEKSARRDGRNEIGINDIRRSAGKARVDAG